MSEKINNGGPAFPTTDPNYEAKYAGEGMTLRDYFAAKALQGFIANKDRPTKFDPNDDAAYCYQLADAMLAEREKS